MGHKILLVDDSVTVQKIITLTFSDEGVDVVTVGNGDEAISLLHYMRPALVMADVSIPGKNGYDICSYIRSSPELSRTPVILLVPGYEFFDEVRARAAGADHYLTKPFQSIRSLIETVKTLISNREAGGARGWGLASAAGGVVVTGEVVAGEELLELEEAVPEAAAEPVVGEPAQPRAEPVVESASESSPIGAGTLSREVMDELVERISARVAELVIERLRREPAAAREVPRSAVRQSVPPPVAAPLPVPLPIEDDGADDLLEL